MDAGAWIQNLAIAASCCALGGPGLTAPCRRQHPNMSMSHLEEHRCETSLEGFLSSRRLSGCFL
jgi:hypothetical protein